MEQQRTEEMLMALLGYLENPERGSGSLSDMLHQIREPHWCRDPEEVICALAEGNETLWARLLSHLIPDTAWPTEQQQLIHEWYLRFKQVSPFASFPLHFYVAGTPLETAAAEVLEVNGLSSEDDEFAFLIVKGQLVPIWVRPIYRTHSMPHRDWPIVKSGR